ncbi:restriction endonuclease [Mycoplasmatota bacterium WC44]
MTKSSFRGKMFEILCRILMKNCGYTLIKHDGSKVYHGNCGTKKWDIKMQGRGTRHQIDLPYDYDYKIPMINPIRVIGEVKFYDRYNNNGRRKNLSISKVRDFFGVVEDIKQNYFLSTHSTLLNNIDRKLEQGLFISASGFSKGAQRFALAHNIKLLSPGDTPYVSEIVDIIDTLASAIFDSSMSELDKDENAELVLDHIRTNVYSQYNSTLNSQLLTINETERISELVEKLRQWNIGIYTYFFGTTVTGHLLLFVSDKRNLSELVRDRKEIKVRYSYNYAVDSNEVDKQITMELVEDNVMFHTTIPSEIHSAIQQEHEVNNTAYDAKENFLGEVYTLIKDEEGNAKVVRFTYSRDNHR